MSCSSHHTLHNFSALYLYSPLSAIEVGRQHTNAVDLQLNLRTHDLVPLVDVLYEQPTALEAACPAERVCEGGIGCEVLVDCLLLFFRRALNEGMDY